ncbi:MAG: DnaK suppressor protein, partial [Solirubrobacteraceae bacterium]|nr:DnaK suppressor protein [Solirubrobacteraceae bacterium]
MEAELSVGTVADQRRRVLDAIHRLDEGSYGTCDPCGEPIAPARLQAAPDVALCLSCARAQPRAAPPRRR